MASKRLRKKQQKKSFINNINKLGFEVNKKITFSELVSYTQSEKVKKAERNYKQNERRKQYIKGWSDLGIDAHTINKLNLRSKNPFVADNDYIKHIKKQQANIRREQTRQTNIKRRADYLRSKGVTPTAYNTRSDSNMYEALGIIDPLKVYKASVYLAICFTTVNGEVAFFTTANYKDYTFDELKEIIKQRLAEAEEDDDGSGYLRCAFEIFSGTKEECEQALQDFNQRGYNLKINKMTDRRYFRLVNRNDWSMREMAEMMCCILEQDHNKYVNLHYQQFELFVNDGGLPFKELFTL